MIKALSTVVVLSLASLNMAWAAEGVSPQASDQRGSLSSVLDWMAKELSRIHIETAELANGVLGCEWGGTVTIVRYDANNNGKFERNEQSKQTVKCFAAPEKYSPNPQGSDEYITY